MTTLEPLLESLRTRAASLTRQSSVENDAWEFMMDIFELGLLLEAEPSRRPEAHTFLDETAPHLDQEFGIISRFASSMESRSMTGWSEDASLWSDLCTRRSALAFFVELYSDSALAPTLVTIYQAGLDQLMRDLSCHAFLEAGDRPAHMPTRHWWWWLPDDPPA
jgi:hypothetical protein